MNKHIDNERGIALLMAIIAIVVVGGLLIGVTTSARLENRQAQNTGAMAQAFAVTELGLSETVANWYAGNFNSMAIMDESPISGTAPQGAGTYAGNIQRLSQELFFLDVTGTSARGLSRQRLGTFVKLTPLTVEIEASLTTRGPVRRAGNGQISGTDLPPAGWTACVGTDDEAGIRVPAGGMVDDGGCPSCIDGDPPIQVDPSIDDDTFFDFGDLDWNALTAMATKTGFTLNNPAVGPTFGAGGECNFGDPENWGDPLNPGSTCGNYFPIIYAPGNLRLNVGVGQGILLIEGDLIVNGTFEFYGIVIVRGSMTTQGGGAGSIHFRGGVMAANVNLDDNKIAGNAQIQYSSCAVTQAQTAAGIGSQLRSRGWLQLFSTSN
ncbi:MAG: hypothetical protein IH798_01440 [Gemmatimonadetes bacterium]|nr:hypothetical protein [Gemmatimonadota bacterium]